METAKKREREKQIVSFMIQLYCRKKHGTKKTLCAQCSALCAYAEQRSDKCPFMEKRRFAPIAKYIATNRKCGRKSVRSCGSADQE